MASSILADNGVSSGSAGIKTTADSTGALALQTTTAGGAATTAVTIDTSQNVGIGTSSPTQRLQLTGSAVTLKLEDTSVAARNVTSITANGAASTISWDADNVVSGSYLSFVGDGSEKVRIDSSGNLLVGTTSGSGARFDVLAGASDEVASFRRGAGRTIGLSRFLSESGTTVGYIQWSGSTTSYVTSSDYRLKNTVEPMVDALSKVAALKPCTYTWNSSGSVGQGFIAHELQEVVPECVLGEKDAVDADGNPVYQGIDTSFLVATLTAAIQEQQALITTLTERITALEAK